MLELVEGGTRNSMSEREIHSHCASFKPSSSTHLDRRTSNLQTSAPARNTSYISHAMESDRETSMRDLRERLDRVKTMRDRLAQRERVSQTETGQRLVDATTTPGPSDTPIAILDNNLGWGEQVQLVQEHVGQSILSYDMGLLSNDVDLLSSDSDRDLQERWPNLRRWHSREHSNLWQPTAPGPRNPPPPC